MKEKKFTEEDLKSMFFNGWLGGKINYANGNKPVDLDKEFKKKLKQLTNPKKI